jgi:hypothetical protein
MLQSCFRIAARDGYYRVDATQKGASWGSGDGRVLTGWYRKRERSHAKRFDASAIPVKWVSKALDPRASE